VDIGGHACTRVNDESRGWLFDDEEQNMDTCSTAAFTELSSQVQQMMSEMAELRTTVADVRMRIVLACHS